MYHTQEKRKVRLVSPVKCNRCDAWLGHGYYFWDDYDDAFIWGKKSKNKTGVFEIYKSIINTENFLNTVFDEKGYNFYKKQIEKIGGSILKNTGCKATVEDVCAFINDKAKWNETLDGILFQDLPIGSDILINRYPYRKRIQAVVYNIDCIKEFSFYDEINV